MKIYNKFVESKKEPSNKNDIWFDGSVVRLYEAGEWYTVTLSKEALEKLVKYAENVKIFKYVDTLPEIGDSSLIYFQKELSDGGIILVPYVYDDEWKQITNSEVFTETSPFGFGNAENSAVLKGGNNQAISEGEVALGVYNKSNGDTKFSIGVGTSDTDRKNAVEVKQNGDVYITGIGGYNDDNFNKAKTLKSVIDNKIDKIEGKDLSSNDFTNALKEKLEGLENYDDAEISSAVEKISRDFNALLGNNASAAIESFNEIIAFLEGIEDSASLDAIIASIQQEIAKVSNGLAGTDAKLTNLSERVNKNEVLIEGLQNTKIDKEADDYYPHLSVGLADNLAGVDVVDSEISFRRSGGGAISDGVARIEAIKGNSLVWNQLFDKFGEYSKTIQGVTLVDNRDGSYTLTGRNESADSRARFGLGMQFNNTLSHIYLILGCPQGGASSSYWLEEGMFGVPEYGYGRIGTLGNRLELCRLNIVVAQGYEFKSPVTFRPCLYDLTRMFGAGNEPTTIEEFYARIPMGIDLNAYNEGEVIHMDAQSLESVGVNQWDEEWELGRYNPSSGQPTAEVGIRNKNKIRIIGGQKYYCNYQGNAFALFYDSQDNLIQKVSANNNYLSIANREFVAPINAVSMIFYVIDITSYNHDICINLSDASVNGKYFPYIKRTQTLDIIRKYFPEGMRSARAAHDELRYNKAKQKWETVQIGEVDMGSLNWRFLNESDGRWRFVVQLPLMKVFSSDEIANVLVSLFPTVTGWDVFHNIKEGLAVLGPNYLGIYNKRYEGLTPSEFKAAMAGVILYYELAEPIVTELDDDFNLDYEVWNGGTEKIVSDVPTSPLKADIAYGFNAVGKIKELEEKFNNGGGGGGVSKDYVDGKLTELSAEVSELSEKVDNLPSGESSVFEAVYGVTTYEEIVAAFNQGKHCLCVRNNLIHNLVYVKDTNNLIFTCVNNLYLYTVTCTPNDAWSDQMKIIQTTNYQTKVVNAESTDAQYPSAKAVYDFVQTTLGTIINGDY